MLLLLHGEETYFLRARIQELKRKAQSQGAFIKDIDCTGADLREVFSELNTASLFDSKKLLIFHEPFGQKIWGEKEFQEALLKADPHTLVFVALGDKKTDPFFKFLLRKGTAQEFPRLKGVQLRSWAQKEAERQKSSFAPGALEVLLFSCGDDAERLAGEISKLAAFRSFSPQGQITREDVLLLVAKELEPKIFSTIDAISSRDRKLATKLLAEHFQAGEEPLHLLSMFAWQLRILLAIKDLVERARGQKEIAKTLKLHPFVFQKSFAAAQRFSLQELKELYKKIFSLDVALKTGRGSPEQLLHLFVAAASAKEKQHL